VITGIIPWERFRVSVAEAEALARPEDFDSYERLGDHYGAMRRWAPAFLATVSFQGVPAAATKAKAPLDESDGSMKVTKLVAGAGSVLCDLFNAQGTECRDFGTITKRLSVRQITALACVGLPNLRRSSLTLARKSQASPGWAPSLQENSLYTS